MIRSISVMIGSGVLWRTGIIPTLCPFIQSASKLSTVSTAVRRSGPLPWIRIMLRVASIRTAPCLVAKFSTNLVIVAADT